MVVLSPKFAILASLSALAVLSTVPTAEAVAIPDNREGTRGDPFVAQGSSVNGASSSSPSVQGADAPGDGVPVLPLPGLSKRRVVVGSHGEAEAKAHRLNERWDPLNPLLQLGKIWIGTGSPPAARAYHDKVVVKGDNDHVHHVHVHRRSPSPRRHHHGYHTKTVVKGDHDRVNVHEKRRSHGHHHYRHHHHGHHRQRADDESDVSVPLLDKGRTLLVPASSTQQRRSGPLGDTIVLDGHAGDLVMGLKRQLGDTLILDGEGEDLVMTTKRQVATVSAFSEPEGVPGTIDIVSNVAGSSVGERVASLVLSSTMGDSVIGNPDPFVLNASGTNKTEIYMVVLPDGASPSNSTSPDNGPNSTYPETPSNNSTTPTNATEPSDSSQTFSPMDLSGSAPAADPSAPSNSSSSNSTDSTAPAFKRVALKIPLFDAESATMKAYCATFDPQPAAPSPLTVENCSDGPMVEEHKSQVFAYDPATGAIQPMWYDGEGDGSQEDGGDEDGEDGDIPDDDGSQDDGGLPDDDSDTGGAGAPPDNSLPSSTSGTSGADVNNTVARIERLSNDLLNNGALIQPPAPSMAAKAHAFVANAYAAAQNVTLMFTPTPPELPSKAADEERLAMPSSLSTASGVPSATSTSDVSSTNTDSYSSYSSTSTISSVATAAAISSTASANSTNTSSGSISTTVTFSPVSAAVASTSATTASDETTTDSSYGSTTVSLTPASATPSSSASATSADVSSSAFPSSAMTSVSSMDAMATSSASATSSDATATAMSSGLSTTVTASGTSGSATHTLGVEVFDPDATTNSARSTSASGSMGAQAAQTSAAELSGSSSMSSTVSSGAPSMTPVSTAPYEWMFKQDAEKRNFAAANGW